VFVCCVCVCVWCACVVCVCVCLARCVVCILQGRGCVCVDLFAVYKQALHAGTARCIFENSTVKNYFVANNALC
jgi:hypothetical protein